MRRKIQDQFTHLPISRQYRWQLRQKAKGLCVVCGEPAINQNCCLKHAIAAREYQRGYTGAVKKNNCQSRRLECKRQAGRD